MRVKIVDKHFRFSEDEAQALKDKAAAVGLSETALIRMLILGYCPREKPDERFYAFQRELSAIGNNLNQLAAKANTLGFIDVPMLRSEAERWAKFQTAIMEAFLLPEKEEDLSWL